MCPHLGVCSPTVVLYVLFTSPVQLEQGLGFQGANLKTLLTIKI